MSSLAQGIADLWNSATGQATAGKPQISGTVEWAPGQGPNGDGPIKLDGARADGGPVWKGGSFLVGENEPEIFTPRQSGQITPPERYRLRVGLDWPFPLQRYLG